MPAERSRTKLFLALYGTALALGLLWIEWPGVLDRSDLGIWSLRAVFISGIIYVAIRAALELSRDLPEWVEYVWLGCDLGLITLVTKTTGGMRSEAGLFYVWPLITTSVQRRPGLVYAIGAIVAGAYVWAAWPDVLDPDPLGRLGARVLVILLATQIAVSYSTHEVRRVAELARLRGEVALGEYQRELSREMHDGIQHYLLKAAMRLDLAEMLIPTDAEAAARAAVSQKLTLRQAGDELRYLVRRLRSGELERRGFEQAVREFAARFGERSGVEVDVSIEGDVDRMPPDTEHAAFRVIQEAMTNIEKYADATSVEVHLRVTDSEVECEITDDGVGFDAANPREPGLDGGLGIPGMRERAETVGGRLAVESAPGQGTTVRLTVPMDAEGGTDGKDQAAGG